MYNVLRDGHVPYCVGLCRLLHRTNDTGKGPAQQLPLLREPSQHDPAIAALGSILAEACKCHPHAGGRAPNRDARTQGRRGR